jgi:hypothetical protein
VAGERGTILGSRTVVAVHRWEVKQHREPGAALDERPDRGAAQAEDEITLPVAGNRPVLRFGGALADQLRRLRCPDCGVHLEWVPWARPTSPFTRDFEDVVTWLAQQMAKKPIAGLLRIAWDTVGRIVARVLADHLDEKRLNGLVAIGVDEIAYRRGQRYLTSVLDHRAGAIVWCAPGRNAQTLQAFFDKLGERRHSIRAYARGADRLCLKRRATGDP